MKARKNDGFAVGRFIIVLVFIAVIAAVIFLFFIPRVNYQRAQDNVLEFHNIYNEKEINNKSFEFYWQQILEFENVSVNHKTKLYNNNVIITVLLDSKNNCVKALSKIEEDSHYKDLILNQNNALKDFRKSKNEINNYIAKEMNELFVKPTSEYIDDYILTLLSKIETMVQDMSNFFHATVEIVDCCSERTNETNDLVITVLSEFDNLISRLLSTTIIDNNDILKLRSQADIMLRSDFYKTYNDEGYTVNGVKEILRNICGGYYDDYDNYYDDYYYDDNSKNINSRSAYNNVLNFNRIYYEKNFDGDFDYYWKQVFRFQNIPNAYHSQLYNYNTILTVFLDMKGNSLKALSNVRVNSNYETLVKEQNKMLRYVKESKNEAYKYLAENMKPYYINSGNVGNEVYQNLLNRVKNMLLNMSDFYKITNMITQNHSIRTNETNEIVVTALIGLEDACSRLLSTPNIKGFDIIELRKQADIMLKSDFYKKYNNGETVLSVKERLNNIC